MIRLLLKSPHLYNNPIFILTTYSNFSLMAFIYPAPTSAKLNIGSVKCPGILTQYPFSTTNNQ